jgi:hypothetical protein
VDAQQRDEEQPDDLEDSGPEVEHGVILKHPEQGVGGEMLAAALAKPSLEG